jgi:NAD(P)-dependent dehydrogenase (short-subunit alcohol dehydrogenase family)
MTDHGNGSRSASRTEGTKARDATLLSARKNRTRLTHCAVSKAKADMNTIVMTGATSGIGKVAAEQIREMPGVHLVVGARVAPPDGREVVLPLDLARLESVRAFVRQLEAALGDRQINGLVLNAGTQFGNIDQRTEDGFEATFAVNHLAHYMLLRLLTPRLAARRT